MSSRRENRPVIRNPELGRAVEEILDKIGLDEAGERRQLVMEMVATTIKLVRDGASRKDLKLLNTSLKELRYAGLVFGPYEGIRKVAIFGSARTAEGDPNYRRAEEFAEAIAKRGWMVITGGGPGIMAAGVVGAGRERSFGLRIRLPFEETSHPSMEGDPKLINFRYFFSRKITFMREAHACLLLPGGFGTLDEAFELLTLLQTGRTEMRPVVLLETEGGSYWASWRKFVVEEVAGRGMIDPADVELVHIASDVNEAVKVVETFYSNYHSSRYVGGRLVIRLESAPGPEHLRRLNREFGSILSRGKIEAIDPTPAEVEDDDFVELDRVALWFNRRDYGRLRRLIDALNSW